MDILIKAVSFVCVLGVLITVHEWGHFWVARRFGVKVLRFSIGFGQALFRRVDRHGTEFVIAAIPLGGYVRMLDDREENVPEDQKHLSLNAKPLWQRALIVLAGPVVNLIFAALLYAMIMLTGQQVVKPVIGDVITGSPAELANLAIGHEILSIDDRPTPSWESVGIALAQRLGDSGAVRIEMAPFSESGADRSSATTIQVLIEDFMLSDSGLSPYEQLGLQPWRPDIPPVLRQVIKGGPADRAGMLSGDLVVEVNGKAVITWEEWQQAVQMNPSIAIEVTVERGAVGDRSRKRLTLVPEAVQLPEGPLIGRAHVYAPVVEWPSYLLRTVDVSPWEAVKGGVQKTVQFSLLILKSLGRMLIGDLSVKNLSGPITIATVVGDSVERGLIDLLSFVAYLSVSLGVLNLLPIPVLDGGHLMFYLVEAVRGKPLSERVQAAGLQVGLFIILSFMALAIVLDVGRLR